MIGTPGNTSSGDVLTIRDVAAIMNVPTSTVYVLARNGMLPGRKIGKHWRFLRERVYEFLNATGG